MQIKFFVVRSAFIADVFATLDEARELAKDLLNHSSNMVLAIECYRSVKDLTLGPQWVRYAGRKIATRDDYDQATEEVRARLLALDFAKNKTHGYMLENYYCFSTELDWRERKFSGSLNGEPIETTFLLNLNCRITPRYASLI